MKKTIRVLSVLVILCIVAAGLVIVIGGRDIAVPDISDLFPDAVDVPEAQNGFVQLMEAAQAIILPQDLAGLIDYIYGQPVDDTVVAEFIDINTGVFDMIEAALLFDRIHAPVAENPSYRDKWHTIAILFAARGAYDQHRSLIGRSTQACLTLLRLGDKVLADAHNLTDYNIGNTILRLGLEQAGSLARMEAITPRDLNLLAAALQELQSLDRGLAQAIRYKFQTVTQSIDQFRSSKRSLEQSFDELHLLPYILRKTTWFPGYLFKENETKHTLALLYRDIVNNVPLPFADMQLYDLEHYLGLENRFGFMLKPNFVGRMFYVMTTPEFHSFMEGKCQMEGTVRAIQLIVALKSFEKQHGRLPDQLTQLCPDYLQQVPLDSFDGLPFKYSREKAIVYSVGKDLLDSGGSTQVPTDEIYGEDYPKTWIAQDAVFRLN